MSDQDKMKEFKHPKGGICAMCQIVIPKEEESWSNQHHVFCSIKCVRDYNAVGQYL